MAKITSMKFTRLFQRIDGKWVKREHPIPPLQNLTTPCEVCTFPMSHAIGTIMKYHGHCRALRPKKGSVKKV